MILAILWILLSSWLGAAGWILSALHALSGPGYLLVSRVTVVGGLAFKKHWWPADGFRLPDWRKLWRRFHRPAPSIVLSVVGLSLAPGLVARPENPALNEYRETIEQWLKRFNATIVDQMTFTTDPGAPPVHLYFTRLDAPGERASSAPEPPR